MLGEALRLLRVMNDIKAMDLAKQLDISPSYLSEIEKGKKEPPLDLIKKFAKVFDTTPSSLLFFSESLDKDNLKGDVKKNLRSGLMKLLKFVDATQD